MLRSRIASDYVVNYEHYLITRNTPIDIRFSCHAYKKAEISGPVKNWGGVRSHPPNPPSLRACSNGLAQIINTNIMLETQTTELIIIIEFVIIVEIVMAVS